MPTIACFLLEPTTLYRRRLRRFSWSTMEPYQRRGAAAPPPCVPNGYHNAEITLDTITAPEQPPSGDSWSHEDPRWPTECPYCGYEFRDTDEWQLNHDHVYCVTRIAASPQAEAPAAGTFLTMREAPPGAMWFADWLGRKGPDGRCLVVKTPAGDWCVDYPSSDGRGWDRHGTPPDVTATPSIGIGRAGGGYAYHGFLRDGHLVDA